MNIKFCFFVINYILFWLLYVLCCVCLFSICDLCLWITSFFISSRILVPLITLPNVINSGGNSYQSVDTVWICEGHWSFYTQDLSCNKTRTKLIASIQIAVPYIWTKFNVKKNGLTFFSNCLNRK